MGSEEQEQQVEKLTTHAELETRSLQKDADELGQKIDDTRGEWQRQRRDRSEPGAERDDEDESEGEDADGAPD